MGGLLATLLVGPVVQDCTEKENVGLSDSSHSRDGEGLVRLEEVLGVEGDPTGREELSMPGAPRLSHSVRDDHGGIQRTSVSTVSWSGVPWARQKRPIPCLPRQSAGADKLWRAAPTQTRSRPLRRLRLCPWGGLPMEILHNRVVS